MHDGIMNWGMGLGGLPPFIPGRCGAAGDTVAREVHCATLIIRLYVPVCAGCTD